VSLKQIHSNVWQCVQQTGEWRTFEITHNLINNIPTRCLSKRAGQFDLCLFVVWENSERNISRHLLAVNVNHLWFFNTANPPPTLTCTTRIHYTRKNKCQQLFAEREIFDTPSAKQDTVAYEKWTLLIKKLKMFSLAPYRELFRKIFVRKLNREKSLITLNQNLAFLLVFIQKHISGLRLILCFNTLHSVNAVF
jgi:hypothetical protein